MEFNRTYTEDSPHSSPSSQCDPRYDLSQLEPLFPGIELPNDTEFPQSLGAQAIGETADTVRQALLF